MEADVTQPDARVSDNIHKHFFDRSLKKKISRYAHPHTGLRRLCVDFGVNNILKWTLERNVNLNLQPSRVRAGDFLQAWGRRIELFPHTLVEELTDQGMYCTQAH